MNVLDQLEYLNVMARQNSGPAITEVFAYQDLLLLHGLTLINVARAAQSIDLRVDDLPIGPTRTGIMQLHLALSPLLTELEIGGAE